MTDAFPEMEFAFGAARYDQIPPATGLEVAFAGRSNAGKSTAINAICNRKRLAFVSKTPGRTQQVNFFRVAELGCLVDLPGYGYAKVAGTLRSTWDRLLADYLSQRAALRGIVVMMDSRHPFTDLDVQLLEWLERYPRPIHVLLTKCDKLNKQQANRTLALAREQFHGRSDLYSVQLFSAPAKLGVEEARAKVLGWLTPDTGSGPSDAAA
jgi:GTP-binding protein